MRALPVRLLGIAGCVGFLLLTCPAAFGQVSLAVPDVAYSENFNSLSNTGTEGSFLPIGWSIVESGSGANTTYGISDGSTGTLNTYSFGSTGSTDRALGALSGGNLTTTIGASFRNDTGQSLPAVTITYTGEQWRRGTTGFPDQLNFAYSTDTTSLTTGTWTDVDALDFNSPVLSNPPNRALDGNAAENRTTISSRIEFAAPVAWGATFFIRWVDLDSPGQQDGLAIDDFNITPVPEPGTVLGVAAAGLGFGGWLRRSASRRG